MEEKLESTNQDLRDLKKDVQDLNVSLVAIDSKVRWIMGLTAVSTAIAGLEKLIHTITSLFQG